MVEKETRPQERRTGLFIGACGGTVAAASPEMRFDWRISERGAERTGHRPLTLMNSARNARWPAQGPAAGKLYAEMVLAYERGEKASGDAADLPQAAEAAGRWGWAVSPQDPRVLMTDFRCRMATSDRV
jgi:hypothetical protein